MRAVTLCWITASLATLALLAAANESDAKKMELLKRMQRCCRSTKSVLSALHYGGIPCGGKYVLNKIRGFFKKRADPDELAPEISNGCLIECLFRQNGFLNRDESLKEKELRELLKKNVKDKPERVRKVMKNAADKCFALARDGGSKMEALVGNTAGGEHCKQEPQILLSCLTAYALLNCPQTEWKDYKSGCGGNRLKFKTDILALDGMNVGLGAMLQDAEVEASSHGYAEVNAGHQDDDELEGGTRNIMIEDGSQDSESKKEHQEDSDDDWL